MRTVSTPRLSGAASNLRLRKSKRLYPTLAKLRRPMDARRADGGMVYYEAAVLRKIGARFVAIQNKTEAPD